MKRVGYLFEKICDINNIKIAIKNASKGKTKRHDVSNILNHIDKYSNKIKQLLENQNYKLNQKIKQFTIYENDKERIITTPQFYPDQIIHWALIQVIQPIMMRGMYAYTCGSVPKRGGNLAKNYVWHTLKKKGSKYCLKLDIKKYYHNIDCKILYQMFERKIKDKKVLHLIHAITGDGVGLPIGYYTSQWFANFYLEHIDCFCKNNIKYYVRYVDDMVLIDGNKRKLHKFRKQLENELYSTTKTRLKNNYQVFNTYKRYIDFVGFKFNRQKLLLRKRLFKKMNKRLRTIKQNKNCSYKQASGLMSYIGWLKQTLSYNFYSQNIKPIISIGKLRKIISNYTKEVRFNDI